MLLNRVLTTLAALALSTALPAAAATPAVTLTDSNRVEVSVASSTLQIDIPYPGPDISGVCGVLIFPAYHASSQEELELLSSEMRVTLENYTRRPNRTLAASIPANGAGLEYMLPSSVYNTYTTAIHLRSSDGSLQDMFEDVFATDGITVYAQAVLCR